VAKSGSGESVSKKRAAKACNVKIKQRKKRVEERRKRLTKSAFLCSVARKPSSCRRYKSDGENWLLAKSIGGDSGRRRQHGRAGAPRFLAYISIWRGRNGGVFVGKSTMAAQRGARRRHPAARGDQRKRSRHHARTLSASLLLATSGALTRGASWRLRAAASCRRRVAA